MSIVNLALIAVPLSTAIFLIIVGVRAEFAREWRY